jgi:hypothetical protein
MSGFLKTILIIALVYYLLKIIFRYVFPWLLTNYVNRKMNEFGKRAQDFNNTQKNRKQDGDVTIDFNPSNKKHFSKGSGEYVDYEEIKD